MKYLFSFILSFCYLILIFGQEQSTKLHDIKFSHEIANGIKEGTIRNSSAAYYYTYIGETEKALRSYELHLDWGLDTLSEKDKSNFQKHRAINPYEYISKQAANEQIIIVSEAHHKPQHRIFTRKLLKSLYDQGYRKLGLETLTPSYVDTSQYLFDTLIQQRGYPLNSPLTGFYTREPQMGELVRTALKVGFELFAYERLSGNTERDLKQAQNIAKHLKENPKEKILIHCGWYHAIESDYPKRKTDHYMAYHLKQLTGIDPLTIYQDALSEKSIQRESPIFKMIQEEEVSMFVKDDKPYAGNQKKNHFDIFIYHPKTKYIQNRPHWLLDIPGNRFVEIEKGGIRKDQYPVLVQCFRADENLTATPVDIVELKNERDETAIVLNTGKYRIVILDKDRKQMEYTVEIE